MVFNGQTIFFVLFIVSIIWTTILSVFVFRMMGHYNALTKGISKTGLKDILEAVLGRLNVQQKHVGEVDAKIGLISTEDKTHIQRIGIVRFNPFADTGGSQSFTMALLDGHTNGIVMTSLYARTGNRWYLKEVKDGKGKDIELSKEEQLAIKRAFD